MIVEHSIRLACSVEQCTDLVRSPRLLQYVSSPMVQFKPIDPPVLPAQWEEKRYLVGVRLFRFIPFGRQTINISIEAGNPDRIVLRDNGNGTLIRKWDHRITIVPTEGGILYTDRVEISAGILTPVVWTFALLFYRHRQRRWRRLVDSGVTLSNLSAV